MCSQEEEHVAQLKLQREALLAKAREEPTALAAHLEKVHFCYLVLFSQAISSGIGDIKTPTKNQRFREYLKMFFCKVMFNKLAIEAALVTS